MATPTKTSCGHEALSCVSASDATRDDGTARKEEK